MVRVCRILAVAAALLVSAVATAGVLPAQHRRAVAANTAGWRYFKSGELARAAMRFRDALAIDPEYALAHYNLACAASRLREVSTALTELRWLAASKDPVAQARVAKSQVDPDLDFVSVLPAARELLKAEPYEESKPTEWLAKRSGVWSVERPDEECSERWYQLAFAADGRVSMTVREACKGAPPQTARFVGHVSGDGEVRVVIDQWAHWPGAVPLTFTSCPGLEAPGSCFVLASGEGVLGPFHRGVAGASPMHGSADTQPELASARR